MASDERILVNESLLTIAEVSVGFAGFASIVTVLGKRSGAEALQDSLRIRIMLVYSLSVAFLCFLPAILRGYAVPEATVWRLSSAVLAGTALILFFTIIQPRAGDVVRSLPYSRSYKALGVSLSLAPVLGCGLAAAGVGSQLASATYLFSLALLLLVAAMVFVRLVLSFIDRSDPTP